MRSLLLDKYSQVRARCSWAACTVSCRSGAPPSPCVQGLACAALHAPHELAAR